MTVTPKDVAWGSYQAYEGPFFRGSIRYSMPDSPTEGDRRLRVLTATEGGAYDAINMYDRCIVSVGLIQWCEARYFLVSKLLHSVAEAMGPQVVIGPLKPALDLCCAEFRKNARGLWRFHFKDGRGEVDTIEKQQQLFLGCDGLKGSWSATAKMRARLWASCMANVWHDERAQRVQAKYTVDRLTAFLMKEGRSILFDKTVPNEGWVGALRAAYLSFAGNLPAVANKHIQLAVARLKSPKWSPEWCIGVLQELTFGPRIKIYPHRYEAIRPWLERLWGGVELPKTADELKAWAEPDNVPVPAEPIEVDDEEEVPIDMPTVPETEPEPAEKPEPEEVEPSDNDRKAIVLRPPAEPTIVPSTKTPEGVLGWILFILNKIMSFFLRKKGGDNG